jgi:hypothetical protein
MKQVKNGLINEDDDDDDDEDDIFAYSCGFQNGVGTPHL